MTRADFSAPCFSPRWVGHTRIRGRSSDNCDGRAVYHLNSPRRDSRQSRGATFPRGKCARQGRSGSALGELLLAPQLEKRKIHRVYTAHTSHGSVHTGAGDISKGNSISRFPPSRARGISLKIHPVRNLNYSYTGRHRIINSEAPPAEPFLSFVVLLRASPVHQRARIYRCLFIKVARLRRLRSADDHVSLLSLSLSCFARSPMTSS